MLLYEYFDLLFQLVVNRINKSCFMNLTMVIENVKIELNFVNTENYLT